MSTVEDIFLKWVFPLLGGVVGTMMFSAPFKAILRARKERVLGSLNPLPYPAQTANAAGWLAYSYVIVPTNLSGSALLFWVNELGLLLGLFFTMSTYSLANQKIKDRILAILLFFFLVIPLIGAIGVMTKMSSNDLKLMWGFTANAILLMYYAAPLSTVITVIKTKSTASLNLPLGIMQTVNGLLWFGYGLAVTDPFIWVPNAIGACTGSLLCTLLFIFRKKKRPESVGNQDDGSPAHSSVEKSSDKSADMMEACHDTANDEAVDCNTNGAEMSRSVVP
eukprot:jgi/Picsp_1/4063/NSC_01574-R1_protein